MNDKEQDTKQYRAYGKLCAVVQNMHRAASKLAFSCLEHDPVAMRIHDDAEPTLVFFLGSLREQFVATDVAISEYLKACYKPTTVDEDQDA